MKALLRLIKLFSDETRLRILLLLNRRELCVCQLMGVLGVSQPLISRNLSLLSDAGILEERREGKLIFYSVAKVSASAATKLLSVIEHELRDNDTLRHDLQSLSDCTEFQKKTGKCDMKTFLEFMGQQRRKRAGIISHGKKKRITKSQ